MDKKIIIKEISDLQVLQNLANSYAKISSNRMKKTRDTVVLSRDFYTEINDIFKELQASYRSKLMSIARRKGLRKGGKLTFIAHNGRTVAVFLSTNTGFYGELTKRVFDAFAKEVREQNVEATVVGRTGLSMFRDDFPGRSYSYFDLPDYGMDKDKLSELMRHLVEYEEIHIYYGKFKSIINQEVDKVIVSAQTKMEETNAKSLTKYLFEPSLEEILVFFEEQMFSSVLEETVSESQLAKFASRMLAMDRAGEKIKNSLSKTKLEMSRLTHFINNKKQLEYVSTVMVARRSI